MVKPIDVPCPTCGAETGRVCIRVGGADRTTFHRGRTQKAVEAAIASGATKPRQNRKKRLAKRFGAFLRLYGPKGAETHAVLIMGHGPEEDTPQGFLAELETEARTEIEARRFSLGTEWRIHYNGKPRIKLPDYGRTRRVLNLVWDYGVSKPPLVCAGLRQFGPAQARRVAEQLGQTPVLCEHCNNYHVKGKRHGPSRSTIRPAT